MKTKTNKLTRHKLLSHQKRKQNKIMNQDYHRKLKEKERKGNGRIYKDKRRFYDH
uniref:Uncharacterized protein n=1 Tax=Tetranychus urticae TaxID=32264 RepID=T1K6K7_TETUR